MMKYDRFGLLRPRSVIDGFRVGRFLSCFLVWACVANGFYRAFSAVVKFG